VTKPLGLVESRKVVPPLERACQSAILAVRRVWTLREGQIDLSMANIRLLLRAAMPLPKPTPEETVTLVVEHLVNRTRSRSSRLKRQRRLVLATLLIRRLPWRFLRHFHQTESLFGRSHRQSVIETGEKRTRQGVFAPILCLPTNLNQAISNC
jgi:hypothetical protein